VVVVTCGQGIPSHRAPNKVPDFSVFEIGGIHPTNLGKDRFSAEPLCNEREDNASRLLMSAAGCGGASQFREGTGRNDRRAQATPAFSLSGLVGEASMNARKLETKISRTPDTLCGDVLTKREAIAREWIRV
jgi:hypothetical protein